MRQMSAELEAERMIEERISQLRKSSFAEIAALPEAGGEEARIGGKNCTLTTYVEKLNSGDLLAVVQVARSVFLGLASQHTERGLIFSADGRVREATSEELQNTGGEISTPPVNRPPTIEQLVGCSRPVTGLDERYVVKHFLGKTQAEARKMYPTGGLYLTEDFTYMAADGLRYYLPPALDYLRAAESEHDWEFCHGLMCSLYCQVTASQPLPADVLALVKEIAIFCDGHRQKFGLEPDEELFDEYVRCIQGA